MDAIKKVEKGVTKSLCCEICNYNANRTDLLQKHFLTRKHLNNDYKKKMEEKVVEENIKKYTCNKCSKQYVSTSGLYRHKKICNSNEIPITNNSNNDLLLLKDLLIDVVKQQQEQIKELINTLKELIPK